MVCLVGCTSVVLASFPWNGEGATLCPYALIDLAVTHHYIPSRELTSAHPLALPLVPWHRLYHPTPCATMADLADGEDSRAMRRALC
jgi:hypothetical protein